MKRRGCLYKYIFVFVLQECAWYVSNEHGLSKAVVQPVLASSRPAEMLYRLQLGKNATS